MKKKLTRLVSMLLVFVLFVGVFPANAQAAISFRPIISKGKVAILNYYDEYIKYNDLEIEIYTAYDEIREKLTDAGYDVTYIHNFSVDDLRNLHQYEMIFISTHGNTFRKNQSIKNKDDIIFGGKRDTPIIITGTRSTSSSKTTQDRNKGLIGKTSNTELMNIFPSLSLEYKKNVYYVTPDFFTQHYKSNKLSSPIVFLGCCRGYPSNNSELVDAFISAGAKAVYAFDASMSSDYEWNVASSITDSLLRGDTVSEAADTARSSSGGRYDEEWGKYANLKVYGNGNSRFDSLENGSFPHTSNAYYYTTQNGYISHIIPGWVERGDAKVVSKLGSVKPKSGYSMAMIQTGIAANNQISSIYQTFRVPSDATSISFYYKLVTEELRSNGSKRNNDEFQVDILDANGRVLKRLVSKTVFSAKWNTGTMSGVDFPNGDKSVHQTSWFSIKSPCLAAYRGQMITLRFSVRDSRDTNYVSAMLIDSVAIK